MYEIVLESLKSAGIDKEVDEDSRGQGFEARCLRHYEDKRLILLFI